MSYVSEAPSGAAIDLRSPSPRPTRDALQLAAKRAFDGTIAAGLLIVLSPLLLLTSLAIKLASPGPVIGRKRSRGFGGRPFTIYTFRTRCSATAAQNDTFAAMLGSALESAGIDKLPQLVNVVRGEMSLVGPTVQGVARAGDRATTIASYAFRRRIKPGLVGLSHLPNASQASPAERGDVELWYICNRSLWLDIRILLRAVSA